MVEGSKPWGSMSSPASTLLGLSRRHAYVLWHWKRRGDLGFECLDASCAASVRDVVLSTAVD
jgi:hypothetical protein